MKEDEKAAVDLWEIIRDKHSRAPNASEKIVVKWLGWVVYFLSMSSKDRVDFAKNAFVVNQTMKRLKADLDEVKRARSNSPNVGGSGANCGVS
jgi:hypothetical protein